MAPSRIIASIRSYVKKRTTCDCGPGNLIEYLNNDHNYKEFKQYLSQCYALENLIFIESVVAFRKILLSTLNNEMCHDNPELLNKLNGLKLHFTGNKYYEYKKKIDNDDIQSVISEIFLQHISPTAPLCINISSNVRRKISQLCLNGFHSSKSMVYYLDVFNGAVLEIYVLLHSFYISYIGMKKKSYN
eukprot:271640_1